MSLRDFDQYILELQGKFAAVTEEPVTVKKINYGSQLVMKRGSQKVVLSVYNGKKGMKMVWGGQGGALQEALEAAMNGVEAVSLPSSGSMNGNASLSLLTSVPGFDYLWCGSDESGKGDFFGPLVVAAVLVNKDIAAKLLKFGVRDSKELTDANIASLAKKIEALAPIHTVLALKPEMYNRRYEELKAQGKNLNNLLSAGHVAALSQVLAADTNCKFALVDRFAVNNTIEKDLHGSFPYVHVTQQPKAEADMAVAAASILARAKFVEIMQDLSTMAGVELPKGGGDQATACAKRIKETQGGEVLHKLVKEHFANYKRL